MWLISTETKRLVDFNLKTIPKYAILSHRWEGEELSFRDVQSPQCRLSDLLCGAKVENFCSLAARDGFDYVWVDTCCINKESSAELSEAINSMFRWYRNSARCYVYLCDIGVVDELHNSQWFTRGWTLQELIAPSEVHFYNRDWIFLSDRRSLLPELERITKIPQKALSNFQHSEYCIAELMSWSSSRKTTREEDQAYCLLGIFDINMPLIYGEGSKAFQRLQEAIMETSTDLTLFLWQGQACERFGMLASSPSCFTVEIPSLDPWVLKWAYSFSEGWYRNNAGIQMELQLIPYYMTGTHRVFIAPLQQPRGDFNIYSSEFGIFLEATRQTDRKLSFRRCLVDGNAITNATIRDLSIRHGREFESFTMKTLVMRAPMTNSISQGVHDLKIVLNKIPKQLAITMKTRPSTISARQQLMKHWPTVSLRSHAVSYSFTNECTNLQGMIGCIFLEFEKHFDIFICFGFDKVFRPMCLIGCCCRSLYGGQYTEAKALEMFSRLSPLNEDFLEVFDESSGFYALKRIGLTSSLHLYNGSVSLDLDRHRISFEVNDYAELVRQCDKYASEASRAAKLKL